MLKDAWNQLDFTNPCIRRCSCSRGHPQLLPFVPFVSYVSCAPAGLA